MDENWKLKPLLSAQAGKRFALGLTAVAASFVVLQTSVPAWGTAGTSHMQPSYDYSIAHDPATDTFEAYRAF